MNEHTEIGLASFAVLLMLAGAATLIAGVGGTIPFAAIASGIALTVVLSAQKGRDKPSAR